MSACGKFFYNISPLRLFNGSSLCHSLVLQQPWQQFEIFIICNLSVNGTVNDKLLLLKTNFFA